jgi:hypothetical protein
MIESRSWSTINRSARHRSRAQPRVRFRILFFDQTFQVVRHPPNNEGGEAHREDMAGTERLKRTATFVPIEEGFQKKSNHSQKQSRCQTKRSMSPRLEIRSRCALLTLSVPLRPRRDAPSLLLSGLSMELEARIWFAAPQRRDLCAMKTRPSAPGKINAPPRLTSQKRFRRHHSNFSLSGANLLRA